MTRVTSRVFFKLIILSLCVLWSAQYALATTVVRPLDEEMIVGARAIITGKVLKVESAIDQQDRIFTYITVKVAEVIKGQIAERRIILKEFGGVVGDRVSVVYGNPQFTRGERVLLYLGTHDDGSLRTYQMFLGKFSIETDEATGKTFAVRDSGGENVHILTAPGEQQGESTDRMELDPYTELVRTKLAVNLDRAKAFEEQYYRNVPVLASPPSFVTSKKTFHSEYTFLGNVRWFQPDTGLPVPYTINPDPGAAGSAPDPADIAAAVGAWTGISGCSLTFSYSGQLNTCYTQTGTPGINFVSNNCDGHNQPTSGCASILAIGGWSGGGSQTRVLGGITFGQITQGFVSFNPWAACYFSDHCNFREIATHEAGHALGLAHSADSTATMAPFAHFDGRCASIKQDDTNGIKFLYPGTAAPGPLAVATTSLAGGTVGSSYSQTLTGTGGTVPYTWSLVAGAGTLPPGLGLNTAGLITGTPNTSGTYNFTVKVTDTPGATAQKALSIVVVPAGSGPLNSQFVSQTVPTSLQPGQVFDVNMKFLNTGTETWAGLLFYLASQNPALNSTWGGNAVTLSAFAVSSGQQLDVTFSAVAPLTPGTYNFQWQTYKNDGSGFFGQMSTNVQIQVGTPPPPPPPLVDNAVFVSQSVSQSMTTGQTLGVSVTMRNSGTTTWAAGSYYLGSQNAAANTTWGLNRVNVASAVAPGAQTTFSFNVTAPSAASTYNFQWQMRKDAGASFGAMSTNVSVVVSNSTISKRPFDFDGDGKADITVYRPSNGYWYVIGSSNGQVQVQPWGLPGDVAVPGDYDADGRTDMAVYRPTNGNWYIINSSTGQVRIQQWGLVGDKPVPADYDGDGKTDIAVFRPSDGNWFIINSANGQVKIQQWALSGDKPVPADYDGDGKADITVYRPSNGYWFVINSSNAQVRVVPWGLPGDMAAPADYDGDGKTDIAVFRPSDGNWFIVNSATGQVKIQQWALGGDKPVPADYDGDGKADIAVYRPSDGNWFIIKSTNSQVTIRQWGVVGDMPVPLSAVQ